MSRLLAPLLLAGAALLLPGPGHAAPTLLAVGTLSGSSAGPDADLSGLKTPLEDGTPGNFLGGLGSALAWAGGNTFLAAPDRGPNATAYNGAVDNTTSYIPRFHTITMTLTPRPAGAPTPFELTPTLASTTLLSSRTQLAYGTGAGLGNRADGTPIGTGAPSRNGSETWYFSGRSDNFGSGPSGNPDNARLDPEGLRVAADGRSVYISDEYGPSVIQFDRATGERLRSFPLPSRFYAATLRATGKAENRQNASGRVANRGMEGLAITPDGKMLVGIMQDALAQDAAHAATKHLLRIVTIDTATGATHDYAYQLSTGSGVSEITAVNNHLFLVDERDGRGRGDGTDAKNKRLYQIDLTGATDIAGLGPDAALAAVVPKKAFLDLVAFLNANGIASTDIPAKIEGLAFGPDVQLNGTTLHTLWIATDNDFVPATAGPNTFYVIGVSDADLGGAVFAPQHVTER